MMPLRTLGLMFTCIPFFFSGLSSSECQTRVKQTPCGNCIANTEPGEAPHPGDLKRNPARSGSAASRNAGTTEPPDSAVAPTRKTAAPESLFDATHNKFNPVEVNIEVKATEDGETLATPEAVQVGGEEIINAAGSYGDFMRYLQVLPGVVATSDTSDEVLVRGGHPIENLYLVDGIEIPNINHIARLGTTGGFAPMIDSAVVQSLRLRTGGYDASFPDRLSSVTEVNLLVPNRRRGHVEGDLGIQGIGGLTESKILRGDLLVSAHHALLDEVAPNAGLPSYTNELARFRIAGASDSTINVLNVAGWDSVEITPCMSDQDETTSIYSQYSGWRETTGVQWQKLTSDRSFGVFSVADSEQVQHIQQEDQFVDPAKAKAASISCPIPRNDIQTTPVYMEDSNSAVSSTSYRYRWENSRLAISVGTAAWLERPDFNIAQPAGILSPYSVAPVRTDSVSFATNFATGETGSFIDVTYQGIRKLSLSFGSRLQTFAFGSHTTYTYRASARYGLGEHAALNAAFATYAQLPPYIYLVSFEQDRTLLPMRVNHRIIGLEFDGLRKSRIHVEAYDKPYSDTPAASEYPTVTLHNMPDQLGDEIVWFPMNSLGRGHASGIELSESTQIGSKIMLKSSLAYARAKFAGEDGIYRPSDFDFPWIFNLLSNAHIGRGYGASARFGYASGRPYTPYDMPDSLAQNRPIYDLQRVNQLRAPYYARFDAQMNKDILVRGSHLEIYAGVDNITNRENFLTYAWMPINNLSNPNRYPVRQLDQMPIFPNFGVRFIVR